MRRPRCYKDCRATEEDDDDDDDLFVRFFLYDRRSHFIRADGVRFWRVFCFDVVVFKDFLRDMALLLTRCKEKFGFTSGLENKSLSSHVQTWRSHAMLVCVFSPIITDLTHKWKRVEGVQNAKKADRNIILALLEYFQSWRSCYFWSRMKYLYAEIR